MSLKQKYIRTDKNQIIVFSELMEHKDFKHFNPVSAGFIAIGIKLEKCGNEDYSVPHCNCFGESISLGLESKPEDSELARKQILGRI